MPLRTGRPRRAAVGPAMALAALLCGPAAAQAPTGLAVVGFGDYLWLRVDGKPVALEPGAPAYEIPLGARAAVAQGAATILARDTLLRVDAGDDFTATMADGQVRLLVNAGAVEVAAPGRPPIIVDAGRFAALTGPEAGLAPGGGPPPMTPPAAAAPQVSAPPPAPAAPPAPPFQPQPPAPVPAASLPVPPSPPAAAAEEWDPLAALASGLGRLARLRRPEVKLVLELRPFYRLQQTYDSNIYLVPEDKPDGTRVGGGVLGSWITLNELGTGWKLPFDKRRVLKGLYSARATNYSTQPRTNNAVDQDVRAAFDFGGRGLDASLWGNHLNTEDPAFSEQVARQRRFLNEVGFSLDVERSRALVFGLSAKHQLHKYLDPSLAANLNRFESSFGGQAGVKLAPKTKLYLAYARELVHYSAGRSDHSRSHRVGLGVSGRLSERLSGRAQADLQARRYERPPAGQRRDVNTLVTAVDLKFQAARRTELTLRVFRALQETTFAGNRYYTATGGGLGARHTWRKLTLSGDATFETDRYPESVTLGGTSGNRRDDLYSAAARAEYKVRPWLSTDLSYQRLQRHSKFSGQFDYAAHRTSLGLRLQF